MFAPTEPDLFTTTSPPLFELLCSYVTDDQAHVLHVDFEGRCTRNIKIIGGDNWCQHAEALCLAWAVDGHPVELWWPGDPVPLAFIEAAKNPRWIVTSFNAAFERSVFRHILIPKFGFPEIPLEQWRCSQAMAAALALPLDLDQLAEALDLNHRKDATGHKLMMKMTKPRKPLKREDPTALL